MLAVENIEVARALRCIREKYADASLQVADIVAATGLSRRPLEIAFKSEVGRTINHEVIRTRIEKTKELLRNTNESIIDIASATGFCRSNHLHRVFRAATGVSPKIFRHHAQA